jgi:thiamine pyrophosphokinase
MSSHHIVRENQEPALLIFDSHAIHIKFVEQLLEWSPTIIVTEAAIDEVLSWGIKIDVALVSNTYLVPQKLLNQSPISIIKHNNISLQAAFSYIVQNNISALNALVNDITDIDFIASLSTSMDVVVFVNQVRYSLVRGGSYKKWLVQGTQLCIYPTIVFHASGLTQQLQAIATGMVKIDASCTFWVGELIL